MSVYHEIQRRVGHVAHIIRAGIPDLWAVFGIIIFFVGGSAWLAIAWGINHLAWGIVAALLIIVLLLVEGSYRESRKIIRTGESPRLKVLRELSAEGQIIRSRLPENDKRGLVSLPSDLLRDFEAWKARSVSALETMACLSNSVSWADILWHEPV
jgi:hypothetical protein